MKILRYTYLIVIAAVTAVMAACSSESETLEQPQPNEGETLQLRIATGMASHKTTRARTTEWLDTNAQDEEMMNLWVVVVTKTSDGSVEKCFACRPEAGAKREIDDVATLFKGAYTVYSFANISVTNVCTLLGLTAPATIPTIGSTPTEIAVTGTVSNAANKVATINGNGFNPSATDNGFGETGIPMSNVQTTAATDTQKDLIVVRMLAKMKVTLQNETGADVIIKYASISNITSNAANNLKLLPQWTSATGKDNMDVVQHGDLQPNLNGTPATTELSIPDMASSTALANYATREVTFYVNECATGTDFEITIGLGDATSTKEYRYALIDNRGATTDDNDKWNYIARNDYRIIPIVLDDYKLELIPYDFPPIGVYPVSVSEVDAENHIYAFTFHDYGHFHLVPKVTKTSNSSTVAYSSEATPSGTAWTLNTNFAGSWKTAATKGGEWLDADGITSNGFYRNQTATTDGDDAGGAPVWYANTSSPQWDPAGGTNYTPFIFGYIADPGDTWWALDPEPVAVDPDAPSADQRPDKQIYHEFRVKLYVGGTYRRDLLYRFYMTLSKDQMLGARAAAPMPRKGH